MTSEKPLSEKLLDMAQRIEASLGRQPDADTLREASKRLKAQETKTQNPKPKSKQKKD